MVGAKFKYGDDIRESFKYQDMNLLIGEWRKKIDGFYFPPHANILFKIQYQWRYDFFKEVTSFYKEWYELSNITAYGYDGRFYGEEHVTFIARFNYVPILKPYYEEQLDAFILNNLTP